jgi:uncharacterized protein YqeY
MLKQRIEQDLKNAMLGGDKLRVSTLRIIKSTILYAEVAKGSRDVGLGDDEIVDLLFKEAKKRQEAAELYRKVGEDDRADAESAEKAIIEAYLPHQLSDDDLKQMVSKAIVGSGASSLKDMGRVIGEVKKQAGATAEGARIAHFVKEGLTK